MVLEVLRRLLRGLDWFTWLRWPLMALGLAVVALIITSGAQGCRTGRVILSSSVHPDSVITLDLVHGYGEHEEHISIYRGAADIYGPLYLPFKFGGDAHFAVTVVSPDGVQRDAGMGYVTGTGSTHYIFIGKQEILYSSTLIGYFDFEEDTAFQSTLRIIIFVGSDLISCIF
jgi:hypothetical protein